MAWQAGGRNIKTGYSLVLGLLVVMGLLQTGWADDISATLDSTDGTSAFLVKDADSNEVLRVKSDGSFIAGSGHSIASGISGPAIGGGANNSIGDSFYATVSGGSDNDIGDSSQHTTIGGGYNNTIGSNALYAVVGGGYANAIGKKSWRTTVGGGWENVIGEFSYNSTISGGKDNTIGNDVYSATISGGWKNTIGNNSSRATIGGGVYNVIGTNSVHATIPGGGECSVGDNADYAFAAGRNAKANHQGSFVWADSTNADFSSTTNDQFLIRASGGVGIGTTSPDEMLEVIGNVKATAFFGSGTGITEAAKLTGDQNFDSGTLFIDSTDDEVGIGTSDPQGLLHVQGTSNDVVLIRGTDSVPKLHFRRTTSGIDWVLRHESAVPSKFHFQTELSDGNEVLTLVSDGKVGIGTTAPARKLHVKDVLRLEPRSSAPGSPSAGDMYFSSTVNKLMVHDGSTWQACW